MKIVDNFYSFNDVLAHLDMAKKCYKIINQAYRYEIFIKEDYVTRELYYAVVLKLIEDDRLYGDKSNKEVL